ncbi:MAG: hypothetical protein WC220_14645, partial [Pedobacter sp.]
MKKIAKLSIIMGTFLFALFLMLTPFTSILAQTGGAGVTAGDPEATMDDVGDTGLMQDLSLPEFVGRIISWVVGILGVV